MTWSSLPCRFVFPVFQVGLGRQQLFSYFVIWLCTLAWWYVSQLTWEVGLQELPKAPSGFYFVRNLTQSYQLWAEKKRNTLQSSRKYYQNLLIIHIYFFKELYSYSKAFGDLGLKFLKLFRLMWNNELIKNS